MLNDPDHPEHDHSAALLTVSDILSQHTYAPGPNYENDLLMHVMNARPDVAAGTRNDDIWARDQARVQQDQLLATFRSHFTKIQAALSHECERLILLFMPSGKESHVFKTILHYRQTYIDTERRNNRLPNYTANMTFDFLAFYMVGTSKEMAIRESFMALLHTRPRRQDLLSWSHSFKNVHRRLTAHGVVINDHDGTTDLLDLYYRTPFAHQLTNKEIQILKAGGFFAGGPVDFDRDRIEQYFTDNIADFPREFKQDSRVTTWIAKRTARLGIIESKKTVLKELKAATTKHSKHTDTRTRHRGPHPYRDVNYADPQAITNPNTQRRGPPPTSQYPRWNAHPPSHPFGKGGGKGKQPPKGTSFGNRDPRFRGHVGHWGNYGKGKQPGKGKGKGKGKGDKGSSTDIICWFCNKKGHRRSECRAFTALKKDVNYTAVVEDIPDHELPILAMVVDSIGNPYCSQCHLPHCNPGPYGCLSPQSPILLSYVDYAFAPEQSAFYNAVLNHKDPVPSHPPITKELLYTPLQDDGTNRDYDPYGIQAATDYAYPEGWGYHQEGAHGGYDPEEPPPQEDILHTDTAPAPGTPDDDDGSTSDE